MSLDINHSDHPVPWDCPTCGKMPDPCQWIHDADDKIIGWYCPNGCGEGEEITDDPTPRRKPTRWHSIDLPPEHDAT